jgi:hypothetical protein
MEALGEAERMPHMATAELTGARRNRAKKSSAIQNRQRGLGLESDRVGKRVRGAAGWAGLVWSSPLGLTCPVGPGYQLPVFILISSNKPRKNPNMFKINPKNT